jgi:hypothetical protein
MAAKYNNAIKKIFSKLAILEGASLDGDRRIAWVNRKLNRVIVDYKRLSSRVDALARFVMDMNGIIDPNDPRATEKQTFEIINDAVQLMTFMRAQNLGDAFAASSIMRQATSMIESGILDMQDGRNVSGVGKILYGFIGAMATWNASTAYDPANPIPLIEAPDPVELPMESDVGGVEIGEEFEGKFDENDDTGFVYRPIMAAPIDESVISDNVSNYLRRPTVDENHYAQQLRGLYVMPPAMGPIGAGSMASENGVQDALQDVLGADARTAGHLFFAHPEIAYVESLDMSSMTGSDLSSFRTESLYSLNLDRLNASDAVKYVLDMARNDTWSTWSSTVHG